ncbi:MAG: heme biosynthesis protein HemY [Thiohalomonadales bacterium]
MKFLLWVIGVLIGFVVLAIVVNKYPGYVLIDVHGWVIESTLIFFIVAMLAIFAVLHYGLRSWGSIKRVPKHFGNWQEKRAKDKVSQSLVNGLLNLVEGNWSASEQQLVRFAEKSPAPLLNYLGAARAAQETGQYERRDRYLGLAQESQPKAQVSVGLTQAELQMSQNQPEQALATFSHLHELEPKNKKVLNGLVRLYCELSDWEHLLQIIGAVRKNKALPAKEIDVIERQAYLELLISAGSSDEIRVEDAWYRVAAHLQGDEEILVVYIEQLLRQGSSDLAEPLIRNGLRKSWSHPLIKLYGVISAADPYGQLKFCEGLLAERKNDPVLLLTLGRVCITNGLWGKARSYLEASIGAEPQAETYAELGKLLEGMGEEAEAMKCYRDGLQLVPGCAVKLPKAKPRSEPDPKNSNNVTSILTKTQ